MCNQTASSTHRAPRSCDPPVKPFRDAQRARQAQDSSRDPAERNKRAEPSGSRRPGQYASVRQGEVNRLAQHGEVTACERRGAWIRERQKLDGVRAIPAFQAADPATAECAIGVVDQCGAARLL